MAKKSRRSHGEGEIKRLPNGRARVRWREDGQRKSRNFPSYELAEKFRRGIIGDIARERAGLPPEPGSFPFLETLADEVIERRRHTHRSWSDDRGRWNNHLKPDFGKLRAFDVDVARIRAFCEKRRREGMKPDTLRNCVLFLSTLFTDLCERPRETGVQMIGGAPFNPCLRLPKSIRRIFKSEHNPRLAPYVERLRDVVRLYQAMRDEKVLEPQSVAYAIGACAGLRPGEILALLWPWIHEDDYRIDVLRQVQDGRDSPLKDAEPRIVQGDFLTPIVPILRAWRLKTGGKGLVFPPELTRRGTRMGTYMHPKRLKEALQHATKECELPDVMAWRKPWYHATRHTFATHWMRAGHSLGELAIVLGHSSTWVTERYAHIRPSRERDGDPWKLDLSVKLGEVVELGSQSPSLGPDWAPTRDSAGEKAE